jgi:hypothetical protein
MDSGESSGMDRLSEDLVLLSVTPDTGRVATTQRIGYGLMGSELVRLAAAGKITIEGGRVTVQDAAPSGDAELDAALGTLAGAKRPVKAKTWVSHPRRGICDAYLARLAEGGVLQAERGTRLGIFPVTRWRVTDPARAAAARAILDEAALSDGLAGIVQAAYAGLAHAIGLGALLYPGRDNRQVRKRLERIAKSDATATMVTGTATNSASLAAIQATQQAAVQAATAAAIQAAVDATTAAAADAGGGAHGGGHH